MVSAGVNGTRVEAVPVKPVAAAASAPKVRDGALWLPTMAIPLWSIGGISWRHGLGEVVATTIHARSGGHLTAGPTFDSLGPALDWITYVTRACAGLPDAA